ncbi:flap endonuclease GEN homolog 1 [Lepisosteus oculatus]|uniref:flap endonuclease GEN homolog 1 n=1 Tax=Lepisosteus oculatus TaxID=7918 RepID=UPI0035F50525
MGVNELWPILEPVRESVPLYSLSGKTLAVDLSLWVCEAQFVKEMMGKVTKPYLRNLFFRVMSLTLMGIKLIFVVEGEAPKLKAETMNKRNEMRFGPLKKPASKPGKTGRSHFKSVLKECAQMLDCLGIPWVTAAGEAEALCAYLDANGQVDGCITNDGDAFLYGAQTVYRNFNMNTKDPQLDCYKMEKIQSILGLERETLVGFAILLGCDYLPKGIPGVGKEMTLKLIETLKGETLLQKFSQWKEQTQDLDVQRRAVKKVTHCQICCHPGSAKTHERNGCKLCDSKRFCEPRGYDYSCPCDWHQTERGRQASAAEFNIKKKALACEGFPFSEIIKEFLISKDKRTKNLKYRKPNLFAMRKFALDKMEWPEHYTSEKVVVLITYTEMMNRKCGKESASQIEPLRIFKSRVRNGVACYEIIWKKPEHFIYAEDHPVESLDTVKTVEEVSLFQSAYPETVDMFLKERAEAEENKNKNKKKRPKGQKSGDTDEVSSLFAQMSIHSSSQERAEVAAIATARIPAVVPIDHEGSEATPDCQVLHIFAHTTTSQLEELCEHHTNLHGPEKPQTEDAGRALSPVSPDKASLASFSHSASAVIDVLHLSDIDWAATSFGASPPPQLQNAASEPNNVTPQKGVNCNGESTGESGDFSSCNKVIKPTVLHCERFSNQGTKLPVSELSLRERVIMKNFSQSNNSHIQHAAGDNVRHKAQPKYLIPAGHNTMFQKPITSPTNAIKKTIQTAKEQICAENTLLNYHQKSFSKQNTISSLPKADMPLTNQKAVSRIKQCAKNSNKSLEKKQFLKTSSITKPSSGVQRLSSTNVADQPVHKGRKKNVFKKSECHVLYSSSEDSDLENKILKGHKKVVLSKPEQKYTSVSNKIRKPAKTEGNSASLRADFHTADLVSQTASVEQNKNNHAEMKAKKQIIVDNEEIIIGDQSCTFDLNSQSPKALSHTCDNVADDSVILLDSPLPLAERLKLKFSS